MGTAAHGGDRPEPVRHASSVHALRGVQPTLAQELQSQFESAVAFADLCAFVTGNRCDARAAELVRLAEELYGEATGSMPLRRPG